MRKTKQLFDEVYNELADEFGVAGIEEKPQTLDEMEAMVDQF